MTIRTGVAVGLVWAITLVGVALWAQGGTIIEGPQLQPPKRIILSGDDIGFRRHLLSSSDRATAPIRSWCADGQN